MAFAWLALTGTNIRSKPFKSNHTFTRFSILLTENMIICLTYIQLLLKLKEYSNFQTKNSFMETDQIRPFVCGALYLLFVHYDNNYSRGDRAV